MTNDRDHYIDIVMYDNRHLTIGKFTVRGTEADTREAFAELERILSGAVPEEQPE